MTTKMINENEIAEQAKKNLQEWQLRREWFIKICDFIENNYPEGVKITMRVQKKLDAAFGAYQVRIFAGQVCWEIEIKGIGSNFKVCYLVGNYPTANAGMLLLAEFQNQNMSLSDMEKSIAEKERALQNLPEYVRSYNSLMESIAKHNALVSNSFPVSQLKIELKKIG